MSGPVTPGSFAARFKVTRAHDCDACGKPVPDPDECLCPDCKAGIKRKRTGMEKRTDSEDRS